jgi:uncharacterized membrane protein
MAAPQQAPGGVPAYPGPAPAAPPTWYPQYQLPYYEVEKRRAIDRTKTGLLLLVIGFLIGWIPFVSIIGFILELIGALFVILGRKAFGREHSRNVLWSIVIFIVGLVAGVVAIFIAIFSAITTNLRSFNQTSNPTFQPSLFDPTSFFIGTFIGTIILQISYVLLTFAIQKRNGRILLLAGYAATIDASLVNFFILRSNILLSALTSLAPALLYGYAYYLARKRIELGEIPGPSAPQPPPVAPGSIPY